MSSIISGGKGFLKGVFFDSENRTLNPQWTTVLREAKIFPTIKVLKRL